MYPARGAAQKEKAMQSRTVRILWSKGPVSGEISAQNAGAISVKPGASASAGKACPFKLKGKDECALAVTIRNPLVHAGSGATLVAVSAGRTSFSFLLRDVSSKTPIWIPAYGVAVTSAEDARGYGDIVQSIQAVRGRTVIQACNAEPEASYEEAARHTRSLTCPTWLGLSRDIRNFEFGFRVIGQRFDVVKPKNHGYDVKIPETGEHSLEYGFVLGRGWSCGDDITRHIEDGCLPIVHGTLTEEEVAYHLTAFATLERNPLTAGTVKGTHFLVADGFGKGYMFTPEQEKARAKLLEEETNPDEETVFFARVRVVNNGKTPHYAWFYAPAPLRGDEWDMTDEGLGQFSKSKRCFSAVLLDGKPLPQRELAFLVQPGAASVIDFRLFHRPVSKARAQHVAREDFARRHAECRAYWLAKLESKGTLSLPEKRINDMTRAGLLHLDLVTYGKEPGGTLAPTIGVYCPIGSESSPIVQFFDSMGWHDVARRSLNYFLDKQHKDGFIQNFGHYMLETGPALWSMGEHYRYTRDDRWVRSIKKKLIKSCDFMIAWRNRNKRPGLRDRGYGMQEGKTADPQDPFHSFMLNGYACLGISRVADMLARIDPQESRRLAREVSAFKTDIRASFFAAMARAPVVPLGDGTWCPSCAPWAEDDGPVSLFVKKGTWYTHGTFMGRDSLLGPVYLIFQEVLTPDELASDWLMNWHSDLMCVRNVAFSQPYYSRHPQCHLLRREVKPFIQAFYNGLAGLADRETYTWWEHYFHVSPHKTHEEGWHLMQTRWMLWLERGTQLDLLSGAPRAWLQHGKQIELSRVASYFGPVSMRVQSRTEEGLIEAEIECRGSRAPRTVRIRLPHPDGLKAVAVEGGRYDAAHECVTVPNFTGRATILLRFA
jgi:hypothetical protein